jgi:hypothetical protein
MAEPIAHWTMKHVRQTKTSEAADPKVFSLPLEPASERVTL